MDVAASRGLASLQQPSLLPEEATAHDISRPVSVRDFARGFGFGGLEEEIPTATFGISESFPANTNSSSPSPDPILNIGLDVVAPKPLHSRHASKFSQSMEQISTLARVEHVPIKGRHSFDFGQRALEALSGPSIGETVAHDVLDPLDHSQSSLDGADEVSQFSVSCIDRLNLF